MITLRPRPTGCHTSDPTPSTKFCPRCGGPSTWVRRDAGQLSGGDALARTVCGRCAPALAAWRADERDPVAFIDIALAAPWRAALHRFDRPAGVATSDADRLIAQV